MSSHGSAGGGNSSLTAPLQLPAVVGKPLTTQGGNTLDNGSGEMTIAGTGGADSTINATNSNNALLFQENGATLIRFVNSGSNVYFQCGLSTLILSAGGGGYLNNFVVLSGAGQIRGIWSTHGNSTAAITGGALPTIALVSGTAAQVDTTRDVDLTVPVTYSPTATAAATCQVAISADNVTYSILSTETIPAASVAGVELGAKVHVPAGWYVKLTVINAALGTGTYY